MIYLRLWFDSFLDEDEDEDEGGNVKVGFCHFLGGREGGKRDEWEGKEKGEPKRKFIDCNVRFGYPLSIRFEKFYGYLTQGKNKSPYFFPIHFPPFLFLSQKEKKKFHVRDVLLHPIHNPNLSRREMIRIAPPPSREGAKEMPSVLEEVFFIFFKKKKTPLLICQRSVKGHSCGGCKNKPLQVLDRVCVVGFFSFFSFFFWGGRIGGEERGWKEMRRNGKKWGGCFRGGKIGGLLGFFWGVIE